jgi:hypothetical protein
MDEIFGDNGYVSEIVWKSGVIKGARGKSKKFGKLVDYFFCMQNQPTTYLTMFTSPMTWKARTINLFIKTRTGGYIAGIPRWAITARKVSKSLRGVAGFM